MKKIAVPFLAVSLFLLGIFIHTRVSFSTGGVFRETGHGNPEIGVYRTAAFPRGSCGQCHGGHDFEGQTYDFGLFAPNDNTLCWSAGGAQGCHRRGGEYSYRGDAGMGNAHTGGGLLWPGTADQNPSPPARASGDRGKCVNCHTPHGHKAPHSNSLAPAQAELIPDQTIAWEEILCLSCHRDIGTQVNKRTAHPVRTPSHAKRHTSTEGRAFRNDYKWRFGYYSSLNSPAVDMRHAECTDCHNVHTAMNATHRPGSPHSNPASGALVGVSGVAVDNGPEWTTPRYTWIGFDSTGYHPSGYSGIGYEYQLCFKCHSSWTEQPSVTGLGGGYASYDQTDQSVEFNPNNSSFHWVEHDIGFSKAYPDSAYVNGFAYNSKMYCSDCHKDDARSTPKGPHGSNTPRLLGVQVSGSRFKEWNDRVNYHLDPDRIFCFNCHSFEATGFRRRTGAADLHTTGPHRGVPCQGCHIAIPHGWKRPRLIAYASDPSPYNRGGITAKIISWTPSTGDYDKRSCSTVGGECHHGGGS